MARFLFTSLPILGHLLPQLGIAQVLASRDHEVHIYTPRGYEQFTRQAGATPLPMPVGDIAQALGQCHTAEELFRFYQGLAHRTGPDLVRSCERLGIDVLVTDRLEFGAALVAEKLGLPWATLACNPCLLEAAAAHRATAQIPLNGVRAELGLPKTERTAAEQAVSPYLYLLPWTREFDRAPPPRHARHVGPLSWESPAGERPRWIEQLRDDVPIVLVGSSTMPVDGAERYIEAAIEALNGLPVQGIVTTGAEVGPLAVRPERHVRVERFVPHGALVPRLSGLVTHAGWGTISRALHSGIPMVLVPLVRDEPRNAAMCVARGVAVEVALEALTPRLLRAAIERILVPSSSELESALALAQRYPHSAANRAADLLLGLMSAKGAQQPVTLA